MANRKTLITNVSLVVALVVVAALVWWLVAPHDFAQADPAAATQRTATVAVGEVSATIFAQGNTEAGTTKQVNFAVSGVLDTVQVKVGDTVQKGDILATITSEVVDESISQAQETYNDAADEVAAAKKTLSSAKSELSDAQSGNFPGGGFTSGTIAKIDGNTITIETRDGSTSTVTVSDETAITVTDEGAVSDLVAGDTITVVGEDVDGTVAAQSITEGASMGFPGIGGSGSGGSGSGGSGGQGGGTSRGTGSGGGSGSGGSGTGSGSN